MDAVFIVGIVFFSFYKIIELFIKLRERRLMIDKMGQVSPEMLQSNISSLQTTQNKIFKSNQFLPLRLGAVAIGIGFGWILGLILKGYMSLFSTYYNSDRESALIATTALCAGIALLIVYFIERKAVKDTKREEK
jgi:hypothetical protein